MRLQSSIKSPHIMISKKRAILTSIRIFFAFFYCLLSSFPSTSVTLLAYYLCAYMIVDIFIFNRFNYLNISVVFSIPWLMILIFGMLDISTYTKAISHNTIHVCAAAIFFFNIFATNKPIKESLAVVSEKISKNYMSISFFVFIMLTVFNIAAAGYIPAIRMILTGNSGYKNFGISGIYGFFLAYANALGLLYIYAYFKTKNKIALVRYIIIMFVFALFVTRQNIISLGVETVFVYSVLKGRVSVGKLAILFFIVLVGFSFIGGARSGNIKDIASIKTDFMWIPDAFIWLYSYCYFNILNLDNLISLPNVPVYDLSSLSGFIPAFMRPESVSVYILEVSNFNVSSYLSSLYKDMGLLWVAVFTLIVGFLSSRSYNNLINNGDFKSIGIAAVLYFCAFFSFFVNFWTYLPVIFQIFFIIFFDNKMIKKDYTG